MSTVEPVLTFAARDGRQAVLWSHGRFTEHSRPGDRQPARVIGRYVDSAEAEEWARRRGFERIGFGTVHLVAETGEQHMSTPAADRDTSAGTRQRAERVAALVAEGYAGQDAIEKVANETGSTPGSVQSAYYRWRRWQKTLNGSGPAQEAPAAPATAGPRDVDTMMRELHQNLIDSVRTLSDRVNELTDELESVRTRLASADAGREQIEAAASSLGVKL